MVLHGAPSAQQWIVMIQLCVIQKKEIQFGKPIGGFQLQQKKLAEMITEITKAQLIELAARCIDE